VYVCSRRGVLGRVSCGPDSPLGVKLTCAHQTCTAPLLCSLCRERHLGSIWECSTVYVVWSCSGASFGGGSCECDDARGQGFPAPADEWTVPTVRHLEAFRNTQTPHLHVPRSRPAAHERPTADMVHEVTAPTFKEALKQDKAQFDDCTPCRIVGKSAKLSSRHSRGDRLTDNHHR
jgi:hypothetical protein